MTLAPEGRNLLSIEQRNAPIPVERRPHWIKAKVLMGPEFVQLKNLVKTEGLRIFCEGAGCGLITISQYQRPGQRRLPADRWVKPQEFVDLVTEADEPGFLGVMCGRLVRSSYHVGRLWATALGKWAGKSPQNSRTSKARAAPARKPERYSRRTA